MNDLKELVMALNIQTESVNDVLKEVSNDYNTLNKSIANLSRKQRKNTIKILFLAGVTGCMVYKFAEVEEKIASLECKIASFLSKTDAKTDVKDNIK